MQTEEANPCDAFYGENGFRIEKDYQDRWFFRRPDGRAVPSCGYRPEYVTDDYVITTDECLGNGASAEMRMNDKISMETFMVR